MNRRFMVAVVALALCAGVVLYVLLGGGRVGGSSDSGQGARTASAPDRQPPAQLTATDAVSGTAVTGPRGTRAADGPAQSRADGVSPLQPGPQERPVSVPGGTTGPTQDRVNGVDPSLLERFRAEPNAILRREMLARWDREGLPGVLGVADVAIREKDPSMVLQALETMRHLRQKSSVPAILDLLATSRQRPDGYGPAICDAAVRALGECGDSAVVGVLIRELERHDDLSYDNSVVFALGRIADLSGLDAVEAQIRRLETRKPTEAIALGPWREAMATAQEAKSRILSGRNGRRE